VTVLGVAFRAHLVYTSGRYGTAADHGKHGLLMSISSPNSLPETRDRPFDIVNASGFLFQLAVETQIQATAQTHQWSVLTREHAWQHQNGRTGYVDLVLTKERICLVVDCKRPRHATWVFLVPGTGANAQRDGARLQWTDYAKGKSTLAGCDEFALDPPSPESSFCAIRGQGEGDRNMLERMSEQLLTALDALAIDQLKLAAQRDPLQDTWTYVPLIVTAATLQICVFDPAKVPLGTGELPDPAARFEPVDLVRFRKSLTTATRSLSMKMRQSASEFSVASAAARA